MAWTHNTYVTRTARERQVMYRVVEGHTSAEVASRRSIGTRTVETHRANLMRKLGVRNRAEWIHTPSGEAFSLRKANRDPHRAPISIENSIPRPAPAARRCPAFPGSSALSSALD